MGTRDKVADLLRDIAADEKDSWNTLYRFDATRDHVGVVASILSKGTTGKAAESKMYLRVDTAEIGELTGAPTATGSAFAVSIPTVKGGVNNGERVTTAWSVIASRRVVLYGECCPRLVRRDSLCPCCSRLSTLAFPCVRACAAVTLALKSPAERDRLISIVSFLTGEVTQNAHDLVKAAPDDATVNPHNAILGCMYARYARAQEPDANDGSVVYGVLGSAAQIPPSFRQPFVAGFMQSLHSLSACLAQARAVVKAGKETAPLTPPFVNGVGWSKGLCDANFDGFVSEASKCQANYGGMPSTVDEFCTEAEVKKFAKEVPSSTAIGLNNVGSRVRGYHLFALRRLANECEWAVPV